MRSGTRGTARPIGPSIATWVGALGLAFALLLLASGSARAQVVTEFTAGITAGATPQGITAGPDGNLWFTERTGDRIGRITPAGVVIEFGTGITAGAAPLGITAGPDGNLWFTEASGNRIGRITTAGVVTEFGIPPPAGGPNLIAAGPDGNLWFTASTSNAVVGPTGAIGRITPTGTITIFSGGIADIYPFGIAAGPDGNLWFTEPALTRIGRITTAGVVTEFTTGLTVGNELASITAAPDGNLWFAEQHQTIGRITTAGVVTEFTAGISNTSLPYGIASGSDGNLWFTEGNSIGRITPTGTVSEFSSGITPGASTTFIAPGPDGNLWFSEDLGDSIARITTGPTAASFHALTPCRVIDTRRPTDPYGGPALANAGTRDFVLAGQCGIPSGAQSVAVNIAVTQSTNGPGFLTLYPAGTTRPLFSSINYSAGQTRANNAIVPLGAAGDISAYCHQGAGTVQFILDVNGYFQ